MSTSKAILLKYRHHYGTHLPENLVRKTFNTGIKLHSSEPVTKTNHQLWYHIRSGL